MLPLLTATVDTLAPYGDDETVRLDEVVRGCICWPSPRQVQLPIRRRGLLSSREKKGRWKLKIKGAPKHRIQLEVSLARWRDLDPCRVVVEGTS